MANQAVRRTLALLASLSGGYLLYVAANPASHPKTAFWALLAGFLLFLATVFILQRYYQPGTEEISKDEVPIGEWSIARFVRRGRDAAPLFLGMRLFLGWEWLESGLRKYNDPRWIGTGEALRSYWERATAIPTTPAKPPITYPLYRSVIEFMLENGWEVWFKYVIIFGEILVALGLLLGALTAIAAFFGMLMNFSFLYAGSVSSNPTFIILAVFIILGWRVSGWWGLDRILLPSLGTPWERGRSRA